MYNKLALLKPLTKQYFVRIEGAANEWNKLIFVFSINFQSLFLTVKFERKLICALSISFTKGCHYKM